MLPADRSAATSGRLEGATTSRAPMFQNDRRIRSERTRKRYGGPGDRDDSESHGRQRHRRSVVRVDADQGRAREMTAGNGCDTATGDRQRSTRAKAASGRQ